MAFYIRWVDDVSIQNKRVLLRADFDVSLDAHRHIANDERIRRNLPTMIHLLKNKNKLICISKLGRPKGIDPKLSLRVVTSDLQKLLPGYTVRLVKDLTDGSVFTHQSSFDVLVIENIRFWEEEKKNDQAFARKLAGLADVYVNDAFAMCHRKEASVIGVPQFLPSYGGINLKHELFAIDRIIRNPKKPFVALMGGAKISTKIDLVDQLVTMADYVLVGGGLANTFFRAQEYSIGKSLIDTEEIIHAKQLLALSRARKTKLILPMDVVLGFPDNTTLAGEVVTLSQIKSAEKRYILDIGPETEALFGSIISRARTIVWNGPFGYTENPVYTKGTDFLFYTIARNELAHSLIGGGDTIKSIADNAYLDRITHISTGGGALLSYIEKGTLPGLEALKKFQSRR